MTILKDYSSLQAECEGRKPRKPFLVPTIERALLTELLSKGREHYKNEAELELRSVSFVALMLPWPRQRSHC